MSSASKKLQSIAKNNWGKAAQNRWGLVVYTVPVLALLTVWPEFPLWLFELVGKKIFLFVVVGYVGFIAFLAYRVKFFADKAKYLDEID